MRPTQGRRRDPERLLRLLTNADRSIQLIMADKAHPAAHPRAIPFQIGVAVPLEAGFIHWQN